MAGAVPAVSETRLAVPGKAIDRQRVQWNVLTLV